MAVFQNIRLQESLHKNVLVKSTEPVRVPRESKNYLWAPKEWFNKPKRVLLVKISITRKRVTWQQDENFQFLSESPVWFCLKNALLVNPVQ